MSENAIGVVYNRLHHFLTETPWSDHQINQRRLEVMKEKLVYRNDARD